MTPKEVARAYWAATDAGEDVAPFLADAFLWEGPRPVPDVRSIAELTDVWLKPFKAAFPVVERQFHILMAGDSSGRVDGGPDGRTWVGATGYLVVRPVAAFHGIPAADRVLRLRWGECMHIADGKIVATQMLIDQMDWFEQIGRPVLPSSRGVPAVWPAPTAFDGVMAGAADPQDSARTLALGRDLLFGGLNTFDESRLDSMGMARFFHPNIKWYGPGGIGACLSLREFEMLHQQPWLDSFPNRKVQDLSLFAEGRMLGASGSAGVKATHSGLPFRGSGPEQDQPVDFSGIDFWLRTGDVFTENWVFVDFIKIFDALGIDLMDRMAQDKGRLA